MDAISEKRKFEGNDILQVLEDIYFEKIKEKSIFSKFQTEILL